MPADIPGFYFDAEKNRYFKGPIPASSSSSSTTLSNPNVVKRKGRGIELISAKLLQARELYGNVITYSKGRCNFQEEYLKIQASQPEVWKYSLTRGCDVALEHLQVNVQTQGSLIGTDILLGGCSDGSLSVFEAGKVEERPDFGIKCNVVSLWSPQMGKEKGHSKVRGHLWKRDYTSINDYSSISCMKASKKRSDGSPSNHHVIITSLGSEATGGSLYTLNIREPFCFNPGVDTLKRKLCEVTAFNCTVWCADSSSDGSQAAIRLYDHRLIRRGPVQSYEGNVNSHTRTQLGIDPYERIVMSGTNLGAALVNLETGVPSWVLRCKSDVLSIELDHSGNNVLCGLRNGAVVTIDARQKSEGLSTRLSKHQVQFPSYGTSKPSYRTARSSTNRWFELKGDIFKSQVIFMPSSISCLESLRLYDQYFLASSMDGSIRLYDHRLIRRGPVQSYEGNVNSHTRTQLGIDPYERIVMSGGEDFNLRMWSIKSGEMLFENKFMDLVPSVVCWPNGPANNTDHSLGAWLASRAGIYHVQWP